MKTTRILMVLITAGLLCVSPGLTGCTKETIERTGTEVQVDQELAEMVKAGFAKSPTYKFPDVRVVSFKGVVQLSGFVLTDDQKNAAETIAKNTPGVEKVENRISLKQ